LRVDCCNAIVCEGCWVLLYIDERRRFVFRVRRGGVQGSDRGILKHDDIIGLPYGSKVKLSSGTSALILKPRLVDFMERVLERRSQVIYPKDHGLIIMLLDLKPGMKVLEVGVGSGFTTALLASIVGPQGHVYAYEIRSDMAETARRNLEKLGLADRVTLHVRDAREGLLEQDYDAAVVDMPDPWSILDHLHQTLKPSAGAVFFMPAVNQVERLLMSLELQRDKWLKPQVYEILLREYEARSDALRPKTTMIAHTGYLLYTRKLV
jgi:tRNA (adenine57-N1/adenine58-N1)-methyltransferase